MWKRTSTDLRHVVARPAAPCRAVRAVPARPAVHGQWPAADRRIGDAHGSPFRRCWNHMISWWNWWNPMIFHASIMFNPYFFLNCCSRRCPNAHDANIPMAWGTAKSGAAASMHSEWMGFLGKNYRTPPYFMGKSMVSGEDFPNKTNPPFYWINCWTSSRRTIMILHPNWINLHFNFWCHAIQLQLTGDVMFLGICFLSNHHLHQCSSMLIIVHHAVKACQNPNNVCCFITPINFTNIYHTWKSQLTSVNLLVNQLS